MKTFTIVRGFLDNRKRSLIITHDFIKFENKDLKDNSFTVFNKEDIAGIRYGIHFIRGFEFYIGREYQIFIKTKSGKELKIFFKLFYRRKLNEKHQLFSDIVDELWIYYFDDILNHYIHQYNNKKDFELGGIHFKENCLQFDKKEIIYSDVAIKKYHHYVMIYSKENQYLNKMLYFLKDDNAVLVSSLISLITENTLIQPLKIAAQKPS